MSTIDVTKPLSPAVARKIINEILKTGTTTFSKHALVELAKDDMTTLDASNVLRCGHPIDRAEQHQKTGHWTYRVHTVRMCIVVALRNNREMVVVTGWRKKP